MARNKLNLLTYLVLSLPKLLQLGYSQPISLYTSKKCNDICRLNVGQGPTTESGKKNATGRDPNRVRRPPSTTYVFRIARSSRTGRTGDGWSWDTDSLPGSSRRTPCCTGWSSSRNRSCYGSSDPGSELKYKSDTTNRRAKRHGRTMHTTWAYRRPPPETQSEPEICVKISAYRRPPPAPETQSEPKICVKISKFFFGKSHNRILCWHRIFLIIIIIIIINNNNNNNNNTSRAQHWNNNKDI